jgi:hypothetical protein
MVVSDMKPRHNLPGEQEDCDNYFKKRIFESKHLLFTAIFALSAAEK